jgi:hypothetical protein
LIISKCIVILHFSIYRLKDIKQFGREDLEDFLELETESHQDSLLYHVTYSRMSGSLRKKEYYI